MKDFRFGKVWFRFDAKLPCFELVCGFRVFLRFARVMYEFWGSQRLGMMVFIVFRMTQSIWKGCRSTEQDLESLGLWLKNWIWKVKREDNEISRCIEG